MHRQLGRLVSVEDHISAGREALLHAARSFDPDRGIPFRRWATIKLRGAMVDAARSNSALPKRVYRKLRAIRAMNDMHEAANEDRAAAPPLTAEDADAQLSAQLSSAAIAAAMGFLTYRSNKSEEVLGRLKDEDHSPESNVGDALLLERVKAAILERPEQERLLLERHYFGDTQLDEIAKELGLSKSWTSRLHARAIEGLAKSLRRSGIE